MSAWTRLPARPGVLLVITVGGQSWDLQARPGGCLVVVSSHKAILQTPENWTASQECLQYCQLVSVTNEWCNHLPVSATGFPEKHICLCLRFRELKVWRRTILKTGSMSHLLPITPIHCTFGEELKFRDVRKKPFWGWSFQTQWSNLGLLHCRQILYHLKHQGSQMYTYAFPFNPLDNCETNISISSL